MKITTAVVGSLWALALWINAGHAAELTLIPRPQHLETQVGRFRLDAHTGIEAPASVRGQEIATFLRQTIREQSGIVLTNNVASHRIVLRIDPTVQGTEAYRLEITPDQVSIDAATEQGLFWGVQTLRQLLPVGRGGSVDLPALRIADAPAYAYRGAMLDVSRHFYPVAFVEKQLDVLSYYKINTFHWHLTDDQGWRIEIKRYPKLTEVGAWRTEADGTRYGGYYTQAQIRDVVDYARQRNITVIPEIEMPGHSVAALVAYPELSCGTPPSSVPTTWGVFHDIDCVGKEGTFTFVEHVLDEVLPLFPAPYVHIGGDEVPKDRWHNCAACQALMHAQGLKDEEGLQSYFIRRIQRYLTSKGKVLMGWDEILEGGADPSAIVEAWRGAGEQTKALVNGNRVVVAGPFYLDWPVERLTTAKVFKTDIVHDGDSATAQEQQANDAIFAAHRDQLLGAEAPLWSERANPLNGESKMYPRLIALAENLWSAGTRDDAAYADFRRRLQGQFAWLDAHGIGYGAEDRAVAHYTLNDNPPGGWRLSVQRGFDDVSSHYSRDGSMPDAHAPAFTESVDLHQAGPLKVVPFRRGRAYDEPTSFELVNNLALGHAVTFAQPAAPDYAPGAALTDGIRCSLDFHEGCWAGWHDADLQATVDLGRAMELHAVSMGFLHAPDARIMPPREVTLSISTDGSHWQRVSQQQPAAGFADPGRYRLEVTCQPARAVVARYVRVDASRYVTTPPAFPGGSGNLWLFADELLLR